MPHFSTQTLTFSGMLRLLQVFWVAYVLCGNAHAEAAAVADDALLQELMAVLDESTEIATKSRMNADFVPGIVSVLQGRELEALGIHTVWEALGTIPGIRITRKGVGEPLLTVRGVSFPFSSGNVKVLVNSISMSRESSGNNTSVLLMPISQVDRIEVVRGPASVLYGDFAFMGVVNIITRKGERGTAASLTDTGSVEAHGRYAWSSPQVPLSIDVNLAARNGTAYADTRLSEPREDYLSGVLAVDWGGLHLNLQSVGWNMDTDSPFGANDTHHALDIRYQLAPTPTTTAQFRALWTADDTQVADTLAGTLQRSLQRAVHSDTREAGFDFTWTASKRHTWLFSAAYTEEHIDSALFPVPTPQGFQEVAFGASSRRYAGVSLQDQITISDTLAVTAGLRYDYRDDLAQERLTPRLAAVWNFAEGHTLKAQYAEGFRAPTFFELFLPNGTSRNLNLETIGTTELSYIYRQSDLVARATLFDSQIEDMIFVRAGNFGNVAAARAQGVELEWAQQMNPRFKWQANASYVDSSTTRNEANVQEADASASQWLASLTLYAKPSDKLLLTSRWAYVGAANATDVQLPAQNHVDVTLSMFDRGLPGLTLRLGVKNLLDERVLYPLTLPLDTIVFEFPSRTAWVQMSLDF